MCKKYKFMLWGIGTIYNKMRNTLSYYELTGQMEIVGIVAKDIPKAKTLDGIPLYPSDHICGLEYDYILILSERWYQEIVADAIQCGIKRERLLHYKILQIPGMVLEEYMKLYESRLTILSNNCWGGVVYKTLGLECCSPTKNLFLKDGDYIRFISNLRGYMAIMPLYSHSETDAHSGAKYPVLLLGDIEIHCNHSANPECAIEDWNRRAGKVNFDNLFIEMYTENRKTAMAFQNVECGCRKICFVPWETKEEGMMCLKEDARHRDFWETVNRNASLEGIQVNIMGLLSGNGTGSRLA